MCINGVEYKPLYEVTYWDKKFNGVDKEMQPKVIDYHKYFLGSEQQELESPMGTIKILTTYKSNLYAEEEGIEKYISESEIVCIPWGGNAIVQYYKGKFITGDNRIATSRNTDVLDNKYMYYVLCSKIDIIKKLYRGAGIQHPDMFKVLSLEIPVPPIEVQQEVVRILDKFTKLEAELQAELDARKKQYEHYRENLMKNSTDKEIRLSEIVDIYLGLTATPNYTDYGIKFISAQNTSSDYLDLENVKYISEEEYKHATSNAKPKRGDLLFTRVGSNLGHPVIVDTDEDLCIFVSLGYLRIKDKSKVRVGYLKHWMNSELFWRQLRMKTYGAAKVNLNTGWLKDFLIPVPSIEKQDEIIEKLEVFDTICNDNRKGLPAEIEARHKQYEYYRDKLLTFERKVV